MQEAQFPKATILYGGVKGVLNRWCRILLIYRLAALKTPVRVRWWGETPMMVRWQGHTWMMVIKPPPPRYKHNLVSLSFAKWLANCCALATCMPWTQVAMNATLHKKRPVAHWLVGEQRLRPPHDRHTTATRPPHGKTCKTGAHARGGTRGLF